MDGASAVNVLSFAIDDNDNLIASGNFAGGFGDFMVGDTTLSGISNTVNGFVVKYDETLNFNWFNVSNNGFETYFLDVATDSNNDVVLGGTFKAPIGDKMIFGIDSFASSPTNPFPRFDGFVAKVDKNGQNLWSHSFGNGERDDFQRDIAINSSNDIYITGTYSTCLLYTSDAADE